MKNDNRDLVGRAAAVLPGGVLGSHRNGELEFVVREGQGAHLRDVDGREYIDYLLGSGPMFLGHAHPAVTRAVSEQLDKGTTYFLVNEPAIAGSRSSARSRACRGSHPRTS